jgi:hypothetical protein
MSEQATEKSFGTTAVHAAKHDEYSSMPIYMAATSIVCRKILSVCVYKNKRGISMKSLRQASRAKIYIGLILMALCYASHVLAQTPRQITLATAFNLHSKVLDEERTIVVALPAEYEDSDAHYPVLYLLDGIQNIWHVVGSTEVLTRTGHMPPVIIVGIKSVNRIRDFTPSSVKEIPYSGGGGKFLEFISSELMPYIDSNYRTHPYRILEGHSLGGVFTANTLMERTDLFNAYIVMSPAFWWNKEEMAQKAKTFFEAHSTLNKSLYFSIGTEDGMGMRNELTRFVEVIQQHQPEDLRWEHREMDGEGHMSAPLLTNYFGLKFVFADMQLPEQLWSAYDNAAFLAHETKIMDKYGKAAKQSGENYVTLALGLMKEKNYDEAITVFKRNVEAYPLYPPNYAWLADAYEQNKDYAKALETYQQALERSMKTNYGQEEKYTSYIERLKEFLEDKD